MITQYDIRLHPAAEIFPEMDEQEFEQLERDIDENGLREPLILFNGQLLDGRHRLRACKNRGIEPKFEQYDGDPLDLVLSKNLHRRHLTTSQRALMAARLAESKHGGDRSKAQNCALTHEQAAELFSVSARQVDSASALINAEKAGKVSAAVIAAVFSGKTTINKARKEIADTRKEHQWEGPARDGHRVARRESTPNAHKKWLRRPELVESHVSRMCDQLDQLAVDFDQLVIENASWISDRMDRLDAACRRAAQRLSAAAEHLGSSRPKPIQTEKEVDLS